MQGLGSGRREGRTLLAVDQDVPQIINERTSRNLANTFPFVGGNRGLPRARLFGEEPAPGLALDHHDHHDHHDQFDHNNHNDHRDHNNHNDHHDHNNHNDHHDHHNDHHDPREFINPFNTQQNGLESPNPILLIEDDLRRGSRQGIDGELDLSLGNIAAAGERCIDKVVMVEETEFDDVITCQHSYSEKCHTTYTTDFEPQQEEVCEENFIKECFIEYKKTASEESVEFCHTPLVCEGEGPTER